MRLYQWELKKLISAPTVWVFLALCLALNIMVIVSDSYAAPYVNELSREISRTSERRYTDIVNIFDGYDIARVADTLMRTYKLTGSTEALMRTKYEALQSVVGRLSESGAGLDIYAGDYTYNNVHKSLFRRALFLILTESALFALLAALYALGYEHQQKTETLVYGSRTGRKITRHKRLASLTAAVTGYVILAGFTLAVYFSIWDYSGFWDANVSSMNNMVFDEAGQRPFITWLSLDVTGYLIAVLVLGLMLTVVFCLIGALAGLITRNTYMGFIIVLLICLALLAGIYFCADAGFGCGLVVLLFSPAAVWFTSGRWLTDMGGWGFVPFQETVTIAGNLLLFISLTAIAAKWFSRKDVA